MGMTSKEGKRLKAEDLGEAYEYFYTDNAAKGVLDDVFDHIAALEEELAEAKAAIKILDATCERWNARNMKLEEALKWYADTHHIYLHDSAEIVRDQLFTHTFVSSSICKEIETGARARQALEQSEGEKG